MDQPAEPKVRLGKYDPNDAGKIMEALETRGIPFEFEIDDSALFAPDRGVMFYFGYTPDGAKVLIYVAPDSLDSATAVVTELFPFSLE